MTKPTEHHSGERFSKPIGNEMVPPIASQMALLILAGFDKHYRLFRDCARQAKCLFEEAQWQALATLARQRIDFYDKRVQETVEALNHLLMRMGEKPDDHTLWPSVKIEFVAHLVNHPQPELAETFFNSTATRMLRRDDFHNEVLFVRPAVSTEYSDSNPKAYRSYYLRSHGSKNLWHLYCQIFDDFELKLKLAAPKKTLCQILKALRHILPRPWRKAPDFQIQVLSSLFFRNKGAYIIGKLVNDHWAIPFAIPILHNEHGSLYIDTILLHPQHIATLFSFTRAYFMVDMPSPSAYVQFLKSLLPHKPKAELYTMLGLHKQGKTLFYRDFLHHLKHSHDDFEIAPGIDGMVMTVFTLPSYPYVFKVIKDTIAPSKDIDRKGVMAKYQLVKWHDRVGRMADTWEYSHVALPLARFAQPLLAHLKATCGSLLEFLGEDTLIIRHMYIERRMTPLNMVLQHANEAQIEQVITEYGNAIKQLAQANIFPGDMLFKNFGVTRLGRVVFYDYDEIEYMSDCHFHTIPPPPTPEAELSSEPWYSIGPKDVFPEEFAAFLLGNPVVRRVFMQKHADLLTPIFWQGCQLRIAAGLVDDVFPYPDTLRFR